MILSPKILFGILSHYVVAKVFFESRFEDPAVLYGQWVCPQTAAKNSEEICSDKWLIQDGVLKAVGESRNYLLNSKLTEPYNEQGKDFVVQFNVRLSSRLAFGGNFLKLLPRDFSAEGLSKDSDYLLMFGPYYTEDFRLLNIAFMKDGTTCGIKKKIEAPLDSLNHLYTFILHPSLSYEVLIDNVLVASGTIEEDWDLPQSNEKFNELLRDFSAVGFDVWHVAGGASYDNLLITDSRDYARGVAEEIWLPQFEVEKAKYDEEQLLIARMKMDQGAEKDSDFRGASVKMTYAQLGKLFNLGEPLQDGVVDWGSESESDDNFIPDPRVTIAPISLEVNSGSISADL